MRKRSKHPENKRNLAFKATYCDGKKLSDTEVGFHGLCSEQNIQENCKGTGTRWCQNFDCACRQYFKKKTTYKQLRKEFRESGGFCMESRLLNDWTAYAEYSWKNGPKPRVIRNSEENKLAVLTTRFPNDTESERKVFAVFIIGNLFEGDSEYCGEVTAHSRYRLELTMEQSKQIDFWDFYQNTNNPKKKKWGQGIFRYMYDKDCAELLYQIIQIKKGTEDFELAKEMYHYYCQHNGIKERP